MDHGLGTLTMDHGLGTLTDTKYPCVALDNKSAILVHVFKRKPASNIRLGSLPRASPHVPWPSLIEGRRLHHPATPVTLCICAVLRVVQVGFKRSQQLNIVLSYFHTCHCQPSLAFIGCVELDCSCFQRTAETHAVWLACRLHVALKLRDSNMSKLLIQTGQEQGHAQCHGTNRTRQSSL